MEEMKMEVNEAVENTTAEDTKENKMGVMPMNKLLLNMALPMMASMLIQACYNVVDSAFVARLKDGAEAATSGTAALNAVGMAFPFQTLLIAVGSGTCVGVNALLSKALGEKDTKTVNKAANNGVFLALMSYLVFLFVGIFLSEILIKSQGGDGLTLVYGTQYLSIVCIGSIGIYMQFIFERLLQSTGRTFYTMITQMTGAIINIILDPILIFGYFGFPELKVAGAAVATIIGQICAALLAIYFNTTKNPEVKVALRKFRPDKTIIARIYAVGIPSIAMQAIGSVMTYSMNKMLTALNKDSVAVFTVYFKLQSFFFMPVFGLNNGLVPILSYNYGAQKRSRMIKVIKLSMLYALCFMVLGFTVFQTVPQYLLRIFDTGDPSLIALGVPALKIISCHFLLAWFCMISLTVFQALGNGIYSLIVSAARQLIVLIPAAYFLGKMGGLDLIWWAFPIAEMMSVTVSSLFLIHIYRKIIKKVPDLP